MMRKVVCVGLLGACCACQGQSAWWKAETETIVATASDWRVVSDDTKTAVFASRFTISAKAPKKYCDVKVEAIVDSNGDGKVDEKDKIETIWFLAGEFVSLARSDLSLSVGSKVGKREKVLLRISGEICATKEKKLLGLLEVTAGGLRPGSIAGSGAGITLYGESGRPHFVSIEGLGEDRLRLEVGDAATGGTPADWALRSAGKLPKAPDFLGAAILIDGQFLHFVAGPGSVSFARPRGKLPALRIVTFDHAFGVVADWSVAAGSY